MNNVIANNSSCQIISNNGVMPFFINETNLHFYFKQATNAELKILDQFIRLARKYKSIYVSQETIAQWCGISRKWVNDRIKLLWKLGFLSKDTRFHKTCRYKVSSFFNKPKVRAIASQFLKAFQRFSLPLFTQLTNNSLNNVHSVTTYSYSVSPKRVGLCKKRREMYTFTQDELEQIAQYPKESIQYAYRMLTKDLHEGKTKAAPFKWFITVCQAHVNKTQTEKTATNKQKNPTTGKSRTVRKSTSDNGYYDPGRHKALSNGYCSNCQSFQCVNNPDAKYSTKAPKTQEEILADRASTISRLQEAGTVNIFAQQLIQGWAKEDMQKNN